MQLVLRTYEGTEVRIEVLPSDTFQDLSNRLLQQSKILVDLCQLTIRGRSVTSITDNVMEYLNSNVDIDLRRSNNDVNTSSTNVVTEPDEQLSNELTERLASQEDNIDNEARIYELLTCRFCTLKFDCTKMVNLFDLLSNDGLITLADVINYNFPTYVSMEDGLPNHICDSCYEELNKLNLFIDKIICSELTLKCNLKNPHNSGESNHNCPNCKDGKMIIHEEECDTFKEEPQEGLSDYNKKKEEDYEMEQALDDDFLDSDLTEATIDEHAITEDHGWNESTFNEMNNAENTLSNIILTDVRSLANGKDLYIGKPNIMDSYKNIMKHKEETDGRNGEKVQKRGRRGKSNGASNSGDVDRSTSDQNKPKKKRGRPKGSYKKTVPVVNKSHLQCNICLKLFKEISDILEHTLINHCDEALPNVPCPLCSTVFIDEGDLIDHVNNHTPIAEDTTYPCDLCNSVYGSKFRLESHLRQDHVDTPPRHFERTERVSYHYSSLDIAYHIAGIRKAGASTQIWHCLCKQKYKQKEELIQHCATVHLSSDDFYYGCPVCVKEMPSSKDLIEHLLSVHCDKRTISCIACRGKFGTQYNFIKHQCPNLEPSLKCSICKIKFPNKTRFILHNYLHGESNVMKCDVCLAEFNNESNFYDHIRFQHEGFKNATCDQCNKTFKNVSSLKLHMRTHEDVRKYKCEF